MIGTLLNTLGVVLGGCLGLLIGQRLTHKLQESLMKATGVCVLFLGMAGTLEQMIHIEGQHLVVGGTMLLIVSIVLGTLIGEILNIEKGFELFGEWLKKISGNAKDNRFVDAFVTSSLTICIGAMAIVGAITEGLTGDYSILAAKAILDALIVLVLTVSKGKGAMFAAIPIFILQGSVTVGASLVSPIMTAEALANLSLVGSVLIFCVGVNLIWKPMISVANMLPAILLAVLFTYIPFF